MTQQIFSPFAVSYFFGGDFIKRKIIAVMMAIVVAVSCFSINVFAYTPDDFEDCKNHFSVDTALLMLESQQGVSLDNHKFVVFRQVLWGNCSYHILALPKDFSSDSEPVLKFNSFPNLSAPPNCTQYIVCNNGTQIWSRVENGNFDVSEEYLDNQLVRCDVPLYFADGSPVLSFSASIYTSSDGSELVGDVSAGKDSLTVSMSVADSEKKLPLSKSVFGRCEADDKLTLTIDLTKVRTELEDKDIDFDACIGLLNVTDEEGNVKEYTCSLDGTGEKDGLFSKEKELTPFTDINDYIDLDFDPFPGFDPEHPIDSIANILKWIGGIIKKIVLNIVGILRWLKDNFFILVENIGKLLYNLVVKLRTLIESLFIPDVNSSFKKINILVPVDEISGGIKKLQDSIRNHGFTFTLLGQEVNFYISNYISQEAADVLRSLSSVLILAFGLISCYNTVLSFAGMAVANTVREDK